MSYDGYGYNPEYVAAMGYGGQGQGYTQQGFYNNEPPRPPLNPNGSQGNFSQGYNSKNHVPYNNQTSGNFSRPNKNRLYPQVPRPNPNLPYLTT